MVEDEPPAASVDRQQEAGQMRITYLVRRYSNLPLMPRGPEFTLVFHFAKGMLKIFHALTMPIDRKGRYMGVPLVQCKGNLDLLIVTTIVLYYSNSLSASQFVIEYCALVA